jgi:hypothetical protein
MALVIPSTGKEKILKYLLGVTTTVETLQLKLFSNNVEPDAASTASIFTSPTVANGYNTKTLTPSSWTISGGSAQYPQQTWTFTGAVGNIYGYYVVTSTSNDLILAEKFSNAPYNVQSNGDVINVTIGINLS